MKKKIREEKRRERREKKGKKGKIKLIPLARMQKGSLNRGESLYL